MKKLVIKWHFEERDNFAKLYDRPAEVVNEDFYSCAYVIAAGDEALREKLNEFVETGCKVRANNKRFGDTQGREKTEEREPEWEKWRLEAEKIMVEKKAIHNYPSKTRVAELVKERLNLPDAIRTIRNRI